MSKNAMNASSIRASLEKLKADSGRVYSAVSDLLAKLDEQPVEPDVYGQIRFRVDKALAAEKEPDVYERIVFVEDPSGRFVSLDRGPVVNYDKAMDHDRPMIRYRREEAVNAG